MQEITKKITKIALSSILLLTISVSAQNFPASDPNNLDGWTLNEIVSDEFEGTELDKTKWWILGENGDYRSKWKGRAPGQFVPHNVKVENGDLILTSQWEPNYTFANEKNEGTFYGGTASVADNSFPITQASVMSEHFFKYGYMEIRCQIADGPVTSGFWTTGYHSEIDMIENFGRVAQGSSTNRNLEKKYRTNFINWDPEKASNHQDWKVEDIMEERLAEDYHVYGFEWDRDYLRTYFNGTLVRSITRQELEDNNQWRHDAPQELWLSSEVFSWYGLPKEVDLTAVEFKVDYIRIWQKEINGPKFNSLAFEGPFNFEGKTKNWWSPATTSWKIKTEKPANGDFSLRFKHSGTLSGEHTMFAPYGSLDLPAGDNSINFKIWIDPSTNVDEVTFILNNPWFVIPVDLTGVEKGQWVEVSHNFNRNAPSKVNSSTVNGDRLRIGLKGTNITSSETLFYIDDISFNNINLSTKKLVKTKNDIIVSRDAENKSLTISSSENGTINLYNQLSVLVKTVEKKNKFKTFNISELSKGIYIISIVSKNSIATKKIVID